MQYAKALQRLSVDNVKLEEITQYITKALEVVGEDESFHWNHTDDSEICGWFWCDEIRGVFEVLPGTHDGETAMHGSEGWP